MNPSRWFGAETRAAMIAALATSMLFGAGAFEAMERGMLDLWFTLRGPRPIQAPVAVVAIDEASLARYGQMPWDRHHFARMLERLKAAKVVAFDIAFNEPGRSAPGEDFALAQAMKQAPPTILPVFRAYASVDALTPQLFTPLPELKEVATALGVAHFSSQHQGVILDLEPYQRQGGEIVPALSTAVARAHRDGEGFPPPSPLFRTHSVTLNYLGPKPSIPTYSAEDVLEGRISPEQFSGKAVLIGATATGLPDTNFPAPHLVRGPITGVELHAIATENLLAGNGLKRPQPWLVMIAILALGLTHGRLLLSPAPSAVSQRLASLGLGLAGVTLTAFGLFSGMGIWWDVAPAYMLLGACFLAGSLWQQSALLRSRNQMLEWYASELQREAKRQREQIDGELHDEAQQLIIVLGRDLRRARKLENLETLRTKLEQAEELSQQILTEILRLRKNLVPHTLGRFGLKAAIAEMAAEMSMRGDLRVDCVVAQWPDQVDPVLESELYWLVKEALNNARKHAQAQAIQVTMDVDADKLILTVRDDGKGFTPPPLWKPPQGHQHTGLHRMWVRAKALHGELTVQSSQGQGTRMQLTVPLIPAPERSHGHVEATRPGR